MNRFCDKAIEFCIIFLILFTPFAYGAVQPWSIAIFEVTAALMAIFWFLKMFRKGTFKFVKNPLMPFVFFFVFYVLLQLWTVDHGPLTIYWWATKTELLKIISYTFIFFVTLNTIKTKRQITRILSVIIFVGFLTSIFFLMRYFGAKVHSGIINSDHFSGYLGMIIPLTLGFLFVGANRAFLFFTIITMSAALFFTMSRGGMFSFIFALLFIAGLTMTRKSIKKKGWILSAVAIFIILTIIWLGATPVVERILSIKVEIASRYFGGRLPIWEGTLNIIKDYPIFGTGLGTFNYIFSKYQPTQIMAKHYTYAHSDFLELLSETGIIVFLLFVVYGLWTVVWLFRRFSKRHHPWVTGMSIGLFGSLASIFIHSFADFNLHIPANAVLLSIILPLFIAVLNYKREPNSAILSFIRIPRLVRFALFPIAIFLTAIFIIASVKPALANYYAKHSDIADPGQAINLDPSNAAYHYQLGKLYSKPSAISSRLSAYRKAVELNPKNSKYHQSLAWTYGQLVFLNPASVTPVSSVIPAKARIQYMNMAHKEFQQAISLGPNNPYRHRSYAIWLFNHPTKGNIEKGVAEYRKAIGLKPELATEAFDRYYQLTKNYDSLQKIIPATGDGCLILSDYLKKKNLSEKSIELKRKAIQELTLETKSASPEKKVEIYMKLGNIHRSLTDYDKAITEYQKALKINPKNFWAYYSLGVIYEKQGKDGLALQNLNESREIDPQNSWVYYSLARLYEKHSRLKEAKEMWQAILNLKTPSPDAERIARRELDK